MSKYRNALPQLGSKLFLTDGGLETTLIFHLGIDLPHFASCELLRSKIGRSVLAEYFLPYIETARREKLGFVLEAPTWRANPDWGAKLGYSGETLADVNRAGIALMEELRFAHEMRDVPMVISGNIGPRGDGYVAGTEMTVEAAAEYHDGQVALFADSAADMVSAFTMTNVSEALGIVVAAQRHRMPVVIAFTVETDGRLPSGATLREAIETVDAATGEGPAYYMINCAHPTHFETTLAGGGRWIERIRGIRANASKRCHAELDSAPDLDAGDPVELGDQYGDLLRAFPQIRVIGGCCGTDHRHVAHMCAACTGGTGSKAA
ncbi:homocysteine S-methyltransferase family protein [Hyphomicrobium sp. CS1BSMeth3]|uniref:homocysteine S-methyltransferase family protein n=1 Tax=Hyphomicrobium sp. CS1BSMeth3 TaxID=1892844 RepID=UPI0009305348|nr:homocysteine S-methyltransferase family protein [Hyphomicrobium sp. CS1BSMeth3]